MRHVVINVINSEIAFIGQDECDAYAFVKNAGGFNLLSFPTRRQDIAVGQKYVA